MISTPDVDDLFAHCDPERENLCLYGEQLGRDFVCCPAPPASACFFSCEGTRDGNWSVELPVEEVPPELPEPCLGINFARDGMQRRDWLALVAVHSDSWLMAVAYFYAVKLDAAGRCEPIEGRIF